MKLFISYAYSIYSPELECWRPQGFSNVCIDKTLFPKSVEDIKRLEGVIIEKCFNKSKVEVRIINFIPLEEQSDRGDSTTAGGMGDKYNIPVLI